MQKSSFIDHFSAIVEAPFGAIGIRTDADGKAVRELVYLPHGFADKPPTDRLADAAARQVRQYFTDPDFRFNLPLAPAGTPFRRRVWDVIAAIPRGEVLSYGAVARRIGSAPRAVGGACGANPFPLIIPCHRVTASASLGGFANNADESGFHLGVKRWLLAHEGAQR